MSIFDKGFFTILGLSLLLVLIAVPLALRLVPRNVIYGFRTRTTRASEEIWFSANAYFGRRLIVLSLCGILFNLGTYLLRPFSAEVFLPVSVVTMVAPSFIATLATLHYIRTLQPPGKDRGDP